MIVARGFPAAPPSRTSPWPRSSSDRLYAAITQGHGAMFGMVCAGGPADRWAIVAYIPRPATEPGRTGGAPAEDDRAKLEATR